VNTFPDCWKNARVVPVFKKKLRTDKKNYRLISILPAGSKILEEIVRQQLAKSLKKWNILPKEQHGFQKSRSTSTAAHCAIHEWRSLLSQGKSVAMAMFDLCATFDLVEAELLVQKLRIYGAEEVTCMWVRSYMTDRLQLVQVGNCKSEEKQVKYGVPQVSGLSPLLFVLFRSDMPDACSAFLIMYADNTNCFVVGDTANDAKKKLEIVVLQTVAYMEENKMSPNAAKTEYMLFGRHHGGEINAGGELVKESESLFLLGLTMNKSISWEHHLRRVEKELSSQMWAFHRLRGYLPQHALLKIIPGFFNSKAIYMFDVIFDPTGEEAGSGTGGTVHRLQIKQNKGLCAIFGIRSEDRVEERKLLKRAKVLGIGELSNKLNYMLAWRIFSPFWRSLGPCR
jgi:hypothetical protein